MEQLKHKTNFFFWHEIMSSAQHKQNRHHKPMISQIHWVYQALLRRQSHGEKIGKTFI